MKDKNKGICPLCGRENKCASVMGTDPHKCWCMTTSIPSELIKRVPEDKKGQACICRTCVEEYLGEKK